MAASGPAFPLAAETPGMSSTPYGMPGQPPAQAPPPAQTSFGSSWRDTAAPYWLALLTPFEIQRIDALPPDGTQQAVVAGLMRQQASPSSFAPLLRSGDAWLGIPEGAARLRLSLGLTEQQATTAYMTLFLISQQIPTGEAATAWPTRPLAFQASPPGNVGAWAVNQSESTPLIGGVAIAPMSPQERENFEAKVFSTRLAAVITMLLSAAAVVTNVVFIALFTNALSGGNSNSGVFAMLWTNFGVTICQALALLYTSIASKQITGFATRQITQLCSAIVILVVIILLYFAFWNIMLNIFVVVVIIESGISCILTWRFAGLLAEATRVSSVSA